MATGIIVALVGAWLVLRTVTHDDQGNNLVDRLLGLDPGGGSSSPGKSPAGSAIGTAGVDQTLTGPPSLNNPGTRTRPLTGPHHFGHPGGP